MRKCDKCGAEILGEEKECYYCADAFDKAKNYIIAGHTEYCALNMSLHGRDCNCVKNG